MILGFIFGIWKVLLTSLVPSVMFVLAIEFYAQVRKATADRRTESGPLEILPWSYMLFLCVWMPFHFWFLTSPPQNYESQPTS